MSSEQPGHLTYSPSGTRLALSGGAIGFRVFLNQAIAAAYLKRRPDDSGQWTVDTWPVDS